MEGVYTCPPCGLSTTPWVYSMVTREFVMFWKRCWIQNLPYLDEFFFPKEGFRVCRLVGIQIEGGCLKACLQVDFPKSGLMEERLHLGFDVDLDAGYFRVLADRCEVLRFSTDALLMARIGRVQARALASLVGTVISKRLAWGLAYQIYTRHLYALLVTVRSLNRWVTMSKETTN